MHYHSVYICTVYNFKEKEMIGKFVKKLFGIEKLELEKAQANEALSKAQEETKKAQAAETLAKLTPKERATSRNEPWVAVLDTHVNKENIRNGFFELDWNDYFVVQLKQAGYGYEGDPDEEIVDRWFRDLAGNMIAEAGQDPGRTSAGYINVRKLPGGRSEVE
jgi:hypothetical protein